MAVSFVRKASDIREVRKLVNKEIKIIAKIELKEAMKNLDSIIDEADGVMVARGDLGVQLPLEQVPFAQKRFLILQITKEKFQSQLLKCCNL